MMSQIIHRLDYLKTSNKFPVITGRPLKKNPNAPEPHDSTQPTTTKPRKPETPGMSFFP